jgi:hypothetical protein
MGSPKRIVLLMAAAALGCGGVGGDGPTNTTPPPPPPAGAVPVANEGWVHVAEGSPTTYRSNPPASGPHYPVWARYQEYGTAVPRGYWVHNLEHGAIVFLYRLDTPPATVDALRNVYRGLSPDPVCGHSLALMTPDPLLPRPIAAVAADWLLLADSVDPATLNAFVAARRNQGPEKVCDPGAR